MAEPTRSVPRAQTAHARTPDPIGQCQVSSTLMNHLAASLEKSVAETGFPFVQLVDESGRAGGAYIDSDTLNLLLKLQALLENPKELVRLLDEGDDSEYVDADLETML